jgi:DNA sulfur modification protein DndD
VARPETNDDIKEAFFVRKGGVPLSGKDVSLEINQVLPEGISRFFLFDGELLQEYEELVLNPASGSKIKDSIEAILGVPALTKGLAELRSLLAQAQKAQAEDLKHSKKLQANAERQIATQNEIDRLKEEIAAKKFEKDGLDARADELQSRLEQWSQAIELEKELLTVEGNIGKAMVSLSQRKENRADLLQEGWALLLQPRLQLLKQTFEEDRARLISTFAKNENLREDALKLRHALSEEACPLCEDDLDEARKDLLGRKLGEIEGRLAFLADNHDALGAIQSKLDAVARLHAPRIADRVVTIEKEMRSTSVLLEDLHERKAQISKELEEFSGRDAERVRSEREQVRSVASSIGREIEALRVALLNAQRKLDQSSRLMSRNPEARNQQSSRLVSLYSSLEEIFESGVDKLREKQRERVEDYAATAFRNLTSEPDFSNLEINENYGLTIKDAEGRSVRERSAGAEQIVALSLIDGLNRAGRRGGPIIMDTPFGRLDWTHRANVLRYLPEMAEQVILLVHEGELDPERELSILEPKVGAMYRIKRIGARQSELVATNVEQV